MRTVFTTLSALGLIALLAPIQVVSPTSVVGNQRASTAPDHTAKSAILKSLGTLPIAFVENQGQMDARVRFSARCGGMTAYFTDAAFVMQFIRHEKVVQPEEERALSDRCFEEKSISGVSVFLTFEAASPSVSVLGRGELPGRYNSFIGNDPSQWHTKVPAYGSIVYRGLYPGPLR